MKIINEPYTLKADNETKKYIDKSTCLLDIETTGLNRDKSMIYMIGLARLSNAQTSDDDITLDITLLFAKSADEELLILKQLLIYLEDINRIISFNGKHFDLPYISHRLNMYNIMFDNESFENIDIYLEAKKLKNLLKLDDLKQKTLEAYLDIPRKDKYSGGELIRQYYDYITNNDTTLYNNLITHNLEDIKGMIRLLDILRYTKLYELIEDHYEINISDDNDNTLVEAYISLKCHIYKRISIQTEYYYIIIEDSIIKVILIPKACDMKYYLDNYKEYRYLPKENIIIPIQLLNKYNKKNARHITKEECFVKAAGLFLPVMDVLQFENEKLYKENYYDKSNYINLADNIDDKIYIYKYIKHILRKHLLFRQ